MKKIILIHFFALLCFFITNAQTANEIPIRISSFDIQAGSPFPGLLWKTACFLDHAKFEIQRSYNGYDYNPVHTFSADKDRCQQPFYFTDSGSSLLAGRVFYRLKVGDIDGNIFQSKIVSLIVKGEGLEINSLTPSVVNESASLSVSSSINDKAILVITNIQGVEFYRSVISLLKGLNYITLNAGKFPTGKYYIRVINNRNESRTLSFLKQ